MFIWSLSGASVCDIPQDSKEFNVNKVMWNPSGKSLIVMDKNNMLVAYPHFTFLEGQREED